MKPRKKQPELTRQAILDAAGLAFAVKGYAGTGIGTIVADAGLTKGALFHHFADKRQLAMAWVRESLMPQLIATWAQPLQDVDSLSAMIDYWRDACHGLQSDDACSALVAMAAEVADQDELLSAALEEVFAAWRSEIAVMLGRGQADGWIHRSIKPDTEAGILVSMVAGFSVVFKCRRDEVFRNSLASAMVAYLETLRPE